MWTLLCQVLGGLSLDLHLNHPIPLHLAIPNKQLGTLPIRILLSNLDSRHLKTYPRMLFDQLQTVWINGNFSNF